jgi:hypothetical protein
MNTESFLPTVLYKNSKETVEKRMNLIEEAISFGSGTFETPQKSVVSTYNNNHEAFFIKPGKETRRKTPNIYDMRPGIAVNDIDVTEKWAFEKVWEYLIKVSIIQQDAFKKILVLLYRLCYLIDHKSNESGLIRYEPNSDILDFLKNIQHYTLDAGFQEKFGTKDIDVLDFLHFVDLLGWNEDVKYHHTDTGKAEFHGKYKPDVGRINTLKSVISAPLLISEFILDIIEKTTHKGVIDVSLITTTCQRFSQSRGLCVLSNKELLKFLSPFLVEQDA